MFPESLVIHFLREAVRRDVVGGDGESFDASSVVGSSTGRAEAVLVIVFKMRKASMGERSRVPPSGGMIPRNMFK